MAVILRKTKNVNGKEVKIKIYYPSGVLSKEDRERAEKLDDFLKENMPKIAEKALRQAKGKNVLFKWNIFGKKICKFVDNKDLVLPFDIESGDIWEAIRQALPTSFDLKDAGEERDSSSKKNRGRDHLAVCYEIGHYDWDDIKWVHRWDDWCQIYYRKKEILDDKRVFNALSREISKLEKYPSGEEFRGKILPDIVKKFMGQTNLSDSIVQQYVREAVETIKKTN